MKIKNLIGQYAKVNTGNMRSGKPSPYDDFYGLPDYLFSLHEVYATINTNCLLELVLLQGEKNVSELAKAKKQYLVSLQR